jgi:trigger factor
MKYTLNKLENNQVKVLAEFEKNEWEEALDSAYDKTKDKFTVQGFRKGHAPRKAIEANYGSNVFYEDALNELFGKLFDEVSKKEKDVKPVITPSVSLEKMDDKGVSISMTIQNKPDVVLGNYKGLKIEKVEPKFDEKEVDERLKQMQEKNAREVEKNDKKVENGDIANIDFCGKVDGVAFDGGTSKDFNLTIGSHSFIDNFEDQLIGMKVGDSKDIKVTFPKDYHEKTLAGKPSVFNVKLNKIKVRELPTMDDEWASNVSDFNTMKELKDDIATHLKDDATKRAEYETENRLVDMIVKSSNVVVPDEMAHEEVHRILDEFNQRLQSQGLTIDDYVKFYNTTVEEFEASKKDDAISNVKTRLVLEEIINKEGIKVEDADVDSRLEEIGKKYNKSVDDLKKELPKEQFAYLENDILMTKLLNFLKQNNNV